MNLYDSMVVSRKQHGLSTKQVSTKRPFLTICRRNVLSTKRLSTKRLSTKRLSTKRLGAVQLKVFALAILGNQEKVLKWF